MKSARCNAVVVVYVTICALVLLWRPADRCPGDQRRNHDQLERCLRNMTALNFAFELAGDGSIPRSLFGFISETWAGCRLAASFLDVLLASEPPPHRRQPTSKQLLSSNDDGNSPPMRAAAETCEPPYDSIGPPAQEGCPAGDDTIGQMRACGDSPRLVSRVFTPTTTPDDVGSSRAKVPNIVHFIRYGRAMPFDFQQYLSYLGVQRFIRPHFIFIHGDALPSEQNFWWNRTLREISNIFHVPTPQPTTIYGERIGFIEHAADLTRLHVILKYGGIYLDHDVLPLKSFDALRQHDFTLGRETARTLANGILVGRQAAPFARVWLETYRAYDPHSWARHSTHTPHTLHALLPHLAHVEERSLVRPSWRELDAIYRGHYDWTGNYCLHVYLGERFAVPRSVRQMNVYDCTLGEVMRYIYHGSPRLLNR